jgi:hypothetical protein
VNINPIVFLEGSGYFYLGAAIQYSGIPKIHYFLCDACCSDEAG